MLCGMICYDGSRVLSVSASHTSPRIPPLQSTWLTYSIRVTGPHEDEDWLIGETVDGTRTGGFPKVCQQGVRALT